MYPYVYYNFFKLEESEKGGADMNISLGLASLDDVFLSRWNGSIFGPMNVSDMIDK